MRATAAKPLVIRLDGPLRTCLACHNRKAKKDLCRFAVTHAGDLVWDKSYQLDGRGAYACMNSVCIERLLRNTKKLHKAFRRQNLTVHEDLHAIFRSGE
jgi:predicted RNA-binding protein YlxR (DUF448 family)